MDFYDIGFATSIPINGGHWYSDPFNLFTDYGISHIPEPYTVQPYPLAIYSVGTFAYIPEPTITPVPEPPSLFLLLIGLIGFFLLKKKRKLLYP